MGKLHFHFVLRYHVQNTENVSKICVWCQLTRVNNAEKIKRTATVRLLLGEALLFSLLLLLFSLCSLEGEEGDAVGVTEEGGPPELTVFLRRFDVTSGEAEDTLVLAIGVGAESEGKDDGTGEEVMCVVRLLEAREATVPALFFGEEGVGSDPSVPSILSFFIAEVEVTFALTLRLEDLDLLREEASYVSALTDYCTYRMNLCLLLFP